VNTVYTVAFKDGKYLMVFNTKRNGWEMPGGKIEKGEDVEKAAKREYMEEAGYEVDIVSVRNLKHCWVCCARLGDKICESEMVGELFDALPEKLSFDRTEYEDVIPWAENELNREI